MIVGIVGASVAGCHLAYRLAKAGIAVKLFDPRAPWEKPCGGGLTAKVFKEFPEIKNLGLTMHPVDYMIMRSPGGRRSLVRLEGRIHTVSRFDLNVALLSRATGAGAKFFPWRIEKVQQHPPGYRLYSGKGEERADFLVGADGATGIVRHHVARRFARRDLVLSYGYLIEGRPRLPIVIQFVDQFEGYAWIFPRPQGYSAGIAAPSDKADRGEMIERLQELVRQEFSGAGLEVPEFPDPYSALIPALFPESFQGFFPGGRDYALIGDAAGATDPVTGEGIYWALKTADILADSLIESGGRDYDKRWENLITPGVARAAHMRFTIYNPRYVRLLGLLVQYSPYSRRIAREMIDGTQDYWTLKPRIMRHLPQVLAEVLINRLIGRRGDKVD